MTQKIRGQNPHPPCQDHPIWLKSLHLIRQAPVIRFPFLIFQLGQVNRINPSAAGTLQPICLRLIRYHPHHLGRKTSISAGIQDGLQVGSIPRDQNGQPSFDCVQPSTTFFSPVIIRRSPRTSSRASRICSTICRRANHYHADAHVENTHHLTVA